MKFWESHDPSSYSQLGEFLSPEETQDLMAKGVPFEITGVRTGVLQSGDVRFVDLILDGEPRTKTLGYGGDSPVAGRDSMLDDMLEHFTAGGEPVPARFVPWGKAIGIEPVDPDDESPRDWGAAPDEDVPPPDDADAPPEEAAS